MLCSQAEQEVGSAVRFRLVRDLAWPAGQARRCLAGAALVAIAGLLVAGCGLTQAPSAGSAGFSAYSSCLRKHGVSLPAPDPSASRGFGGGFGGAGGSKFQKAAKACASLRPSFGGGFGGGFTAALKAFRTCMSAHGEPVPTSRPATRPTGSSPDDRFLNGLNPKNPKVAAAVKACKGKLPKFGNFPG